jgi:hypothetical protein
MRDAESYGLQKSFNDMPFADIARKYSKESEDRPNDIISKRGLDVQLGILSAIQEKEKERKEIAQMKRQAKAQRFDMGGQVVIPEYQMPPGINSVQAAQTNPLRSGG